MPVRTIRRLTKPDVFRQIEESRRLRLCSIFMAYFESAGYSLPDDPAALDVNRVVMVLADADRTAPQDLIDALFLIDQMATVGGRDALKRVLDDANADLPETLEWSPADLAVEAWLRDPQLLSCAYASQLSTRSRTLQLFLVQDDVTIVADPTSPDTCGRIKAELSSRLMRIDRAAEVEIFPFRFEGGIRYVVQRGGVYTRHGVWNRGTAPSTIGYQPLEYDLVVFDAIRRELAVKRDPAAEQTALREAFSCGLASDAKAFSLPAVLDLAPIRAIGEGCLWCRDVPGMHHVRLTAIKRSLQPALKHTNEDRASDLFRAWETSWARQPQFGQILKAELEIEFDDSSTPRSVSLSRGASVRLARDDDGELVNEWLRRRGFILGPEEAEQPSGGLWDWLERPDNWVATDADWRSRLGDEYPRAQLLLADARSNASSIRLDGEMDVRAVQVGPDGGLIAVCERTGGQTAVDSVVVALRRLEVSVIARGLSEAMGLGGTACPVEDAPGAWSVGDYVPFAGERFPVYLVTAGDEHSLRVTCNALAGISTRPFVLVTPTRRLATPRFHDRLGAVGSGWLALSECARLHGSGRVQLRQRLDALLHPFLAIHLPNLFGAPRRPRFPTPPAAGWPDVRIRFSDAHTVAVTVGSVSSQFTYEGMGMEDKRSRRPTQQWKLLHSFATGGGVLTWEHASASRRNQKRRERLAKDLQSFFGIDEDPFEYDEDLKGWRARFTVEPD